MPYGDGTGPMGRGPMTGRGFGPCARGRGFEKGFGRGRGFGFRQMAFSEPVVLTGEEEKKILEAELKDLETEKTAIEKKLKELK